MGMVDLVPQIEEIWKTRKSELEATGREIKHSIEAMEKRSVGGELGKDVLDDAYGEFVLSFDAPSLPRFGGLI